MKNSGFTLLEISVAIAMVGVMATIAVPVYQGHITKTQVTEAFSFMEANKVKVADSMLRTGKCEIDGSTTAQGKNGVLTVSGTVVPEAMAFPKHTLKTGCVLTYKFNNADVTKHVAGKTVVADLLNSSVLSRSASTNVNDKFLPRVFAVAALDTAPTLAAIPAAPKLPDLSVTPATPSNPSGETVVATVNTPIVAYFSCQRSCAVFNYLIVAQPEPATMVIDGNTVDFNGLGFTLGVVDHSIDADEIGIYGLAPQLKNPGDASRLNQYSKVKVKISAPDGTSVDGYFNRLANNVWSDGGNLYVMRSRYGSTKFDPTGQLWVDLRNMIKTKGVAYNGVGYRINSAKITYEFIK